MKEDSSNGSTSVDAEKYHMQPTLSKAQQTQLKDDELLMNLGYKPELRRNFSPLEVFGIAFSIMSLVPSIASTLDLGVAGGGVGVTWGWFVASFFIMSVGVGLAELGSAMPTSGGLYAYSFMYAPEKIKSCVCFLVGYANTFGLIGGICSIDYGFATMVLSIPTMATLDSDEVYEANNFVAYGVFAFAVVTQALVGLITTKLMARLQTFCIVLNIILMVVILIALPVGLKHNGGTINSAKFVFGDTTNNYYGYSYGWAFLLSWMPAIWSIGAFDSCIHMSEEASNAATAVPFGINLSIAMCGVLGWCCMCVLAAVMNPEITPLLETSTGSSFAQILLDCLGKKWGIGIEVIMAVVQWLMGLSILVATSRQTWAFSRDGALPFSNLIKKINLNNGVPRNAIIFDTLICLFLGCLVMINDTAADALFSLNAASNSLAWLAPIFFRALYGSKASFTPGPFYLGEFWSRINNIIASCYLIFQIFALNMIPLQIPVDAETMNYTCVINGAVWGGCLIYYWVDAHKWFHGPKMTIEEIDGEAPPSDGRLVHMPSKEAVLEAADAKPGLAPHSSLAIEHR